MSGRNRPQVNMAIIYFFLVVAMVWQDFGNGEVFATTQEIIATKHFDICCPKLDPYLQIIKYKNRSQEEKYIRLLVKTTTSEQEFVQLPVVTREGNIFTSYCSLSMLDTIVQYPEIIRVEIGSRILGENSQQIDKKELLTVDKGGGNISKDLGKGVIVGIVDSGLALTNTDFYDPPSGHSAVIYVWDQVDQNGKSPKLNGQQSYGREYTHQEILDAILDQSLITKDLNTHGTSVSSLCCGYWGVASGADIIFVKVIPSKASILEAVHYIFRKADSLSRPCVINLSYGMNYGGNNGSSLLEEALQSMIGKGRIIVCSAGNRRTESVYAARMDDEQVVTIPLIIGRDRDGPFEKTRRESPAIEAYGLFDQVDIFHSTSDTKIGTIHRGEVGQFEFSDGVSLFFAWEQKNDEEKDNHIVLQWDCNVPGYGEVSENEFAKWWIKFSSQHDVQSTPRASCLVQAWVVDGPRVMKFCDRGNMPSQEVQVPATTPDVIAVASCNPEGIPSEFSTPQPVLVAGTYKPDYYVCGEGIEVSSPYKTDKARIRHTIKRSGSSLSSAILTGYIACMLQHKQELEPKEIKTILNDLCDNYHITNRGMGINPLVRARFLRSENLSLELVKALNAISGM